MGDPAKSLRTILGWQVGVTVLLAAVCAWLSGVHGAISALLGGAVSVAGGLVFVLLAPTKHSGAQASEAAWDSLSRMLKAEGAKVSVIVILLWLVLVLYKEVVMVGFIGTFIVAVIIFSMAIFLRNPAQLELPEADKNHVN